MKHLRVFNNTRLILRYINSYPPYLGALSFIGDLRMRHAVVTRQPLNNVQRKVQSNEKNVTCTAEAVLNFFHKLVPTPCDLQEKAVKRGT